MNIEQREQEPTREPSEETKQPAERRLTITIPGRFILEALSPGLVRRITDMIAKFVSKPDDQMK